MRVVVICPSTNWGNENGSTNTLKNNSNRGCLGFQKYTFLIFYLTWLMLISLVDWSHFILHGWYLLLILMNKIGASIGFGYLHSIPSSRRETTGRSIG